ncbi:hypothetical protein VKT23_015905 [Stygiomarasmius scandens]|uniref:Uncharacterized protein n=1 Tax=Marasmiellus scandens TaxID=2682957 RepID=A0ABR1IZP4_9AGAR
MDSDSSSLTHDDQNFNSSRLADMDKKIKALLEQITNDHAEYISQENAQAASAAQASSEMTSLQRTLKQAGDDLTVMTNSVDETSAEIRQILDETDISCSMLLRAGIQAEITRQAQIRMLVPGLFASQLGTIGSSPEPGPLSLDDSLKRYLELQIHSMDLLTRVIRMLEQHDSNHRRRDI